MNSRYFNGISRTFVVIYILVNDLIEYEWNHGYIELCIFSTDPIWAIVVSNTQLFSTGFFDHDWAVVGQRAMKIGISGGFFTNAKRFISAIDGIAGCGLLIRIGETLPGECTCIASCICMGIESKIFFQCVWYEDNDISIFCVPYLDKQLDRICPSTSKCWYNPSDRIKIKQIFIIIHP